MDIYTTPTILAETIEMVYDSLEEEKKLLLVEGSSDGKGYWFFLPSQIEIHLGDGKDKVLKTARIFQDKDIDWLRALVDADFDRILGVLHQPNVFSTDYHDLECELIKSSAFGRLISEIGNMKKIKKHLCLPTNTKLNEIIRYLRTKLITLATPIALLRLVNHRENLGLNFQKKRKKCERDKMDYSKFIKPSEMEINEEKFIQNLMARGAKSGVTASKLLNLLRKEKKANHDPWQLCRGHDLTEILSLGTRKMWSNTALNTETVERELRLAYSKECFEKTKLFADLEKWIGA